MMPRDFLANESSPQESYKAMPRDFLNEAPSEDLKTSLTLALPRVWEDLKKGGYQAIKAIPDYFQKSKSELPAAANLAFNHFLAGNNLPHPMSRDQLRHSSGQIIAGLGELGKNTFNFPHDVANYLSSRLHLLPNDLNQKIQMGRMPDEETEQAINSTFGQPNQPGEAFLRGAARNIQNISGGLALGKILNPLQITNKGIAKSVTKELTSQVNKHNDMYNALWDNAQKKGFNQVPYDATQLMNNFSTIEKYTTPKQNQSMIDFMKNPTLSNAQKAQSDAGTLRRILDEKAKTTPLLDQENQLHKALSDTEKHIEGNMFKNASGEKNESLANRYHKITQSYRQNVVPYRYNQAIQNYLSKDILPKELVQALSKGSFAAKKGSVHPAFAIRNALLPTATGIGFLGGGKYLYDQIMGNPQSGQK